MLAAGRSDADDGSVLSPRAFGGRLKVVKALPLHVDIIMEDLRARAFAVDLQEVVDPTGSFKQAMANSAESWIVYFDGKPAVLWGVFLESLLSDEAIIWTVTTNVVEHYPLLFLRGSQQVVKYLLRHYEILTGKVDATYDRSIRWLRWLGFEVLPPVKENKLLIRRFELRRA